MSKLKGFTVSVCFLGLLLGGCNQGGTPETVTENTLSVNKEGVITEYLAGDFDRDYYDISELESMAVQEAAGYNGKRPSGETPPVRVEKVEASQEGGTRAILQYSYDSADTYRDFNQRLLYYGTVAQAGEYLEDLDSQAVLKGVKQGDTLAMAQLLKVQDKHVIITDVPAIIYCPYSVTYISDGLAVREDGGVDTTGAMDSTAIIIMKK
ncbi:MAG: hypothetical protein NC081_08055 [Roseburia sp.]|nr:hypothetical protein [Roseburia sp.]